MESKLKNYSAIKIDKNQLIINGKANHPLWEKAIVLTDFCSPWDDEKVGGIKFKALWGESHLFCSFRVEDSEVYIDTADNTKNSINNSDRVELFFRTNASMNPYYCLEIDPASRIMDFKARPNKEFDFNWNWSTRDIIVKSYIESKFFTVEIKMSIRSLKNFGLINYGQIETAIFRAKYNQQDDDSYKPTWITWVDPKTQTPNFHTPTAFGVMNLEGF